MADDHSPAVAAENKGPNILVPMWALTALTTVIVIARVWIRARVVKNMGPDDWLIMVSMVRSNLFSCCPFNWLTGVAMNPGPGSHLRRDHHSQRDRGLWQTRLHPGHSTPGEGHSAQHHRLPFRHSLIHNPEDCGGDHVDPYPESQQVASAICILPRRLFCRRIHHLYHYPLHHV
jgi:hypothetical protein